MKLEILSDEAIDQLGESELARLNQEHPFIKADGTKLVSTWLGELDPKIVAKAQLEDTVKQIIEWGEEPCPHKTNPLDFRSKQYCEICWEELKAEEKE